MPEQQERDESRRARQAFYERIDGENLTPLWEVLHALVPPSPRSPCVAAGWRYRDLRRLLMEAGKLITAHEAERRVLVLENPGMRSRSCITQTLYAGVQLLLPGEIAPPHRHTQSALRLVLEGERAYTAVDGERTTMSFGDFIITPSMTWHEHGNPHDEPIVWLDGLDIPLVRFLDAGFAEKLPAEGGIGSRAEGSSVARFGANLAPLDYVPPAAGASPLFNYRFSQTRAALEGASAMGDADAWQGWAFRFLNPTTGAAPIPTIGTYVQRLPAGFQSRPYRSTDGRVFCCLEGEGTVQTDHWSFEFSVRDLFVIPAWCAFRLRAATTAVLFSFSDRPVQQALGLWREERLS